MRERYNMNNNQNILRNTIKRNITTVILLIMYTYTVYGWTTLLNIERVQKMKIKNNLIIHPHGGLAPMRGKILRNSEYMRNYRTYNHGMWIDWSMKKCSESEYKYSIHPKSSKPYDKVDEDIKKNEYLKELTRQMINMFPSKNEYFSINSNNPNSFTRFLMEYKEKLDDLYVLASLFLMAEGVNIPIEIIEDSKNTAHKILIIKKNESQIKAVSSGVYVHLSMIKKRRLRGERDKKLVYQKKTESVINFFKRLISTDASRLDVPEEFSMPSTYEEFLTGGFLNSPRFLIQSYIFEYIDSVEMYANFITAVYNLINEQLPNGHNADVYTENEKKAVEVFNNLFIDEELCEKEKYMQYIEDLNSIDKLWGEQEWGYPFINDINGAASSRNIGAPVYNRIKDKFISGSEGNYNSYIECALLGIFMCAAFNAETCTYDISHLPMPSKELKEFFTKYSSPHIPVTQVVIKDWCRVVADLPCQYVEYDLKNNNKIQPGLLNILHVIRAIAGEDERLEWAIQVLSRGIHRICKSNANKKKTVENPNPTIIYKGIVKKTAIQKYECGCGCHKGCTGGIEYTDGEDFVKNVFWTKQQVHYTDNSRDNNVYGHGHSNNDKDDDDFMNLERKEIEETIAEGLKYLSRDMNIEIEPLSLDLINDETQCDLVLNEPITIHLTKNNWSGNFQLNAEIVTELGTNGLENNCADTSWSISNDNGLNKYSSIKKAYRELKNKYINGNNNYTDCIVCQYLIIERNRVLHAVKPSSSCRRNKKLRKNKIWDNPNNLMLWGNLDNIKHKSEIIKEFLYNNSTRLDLNNPMVRFTSNLIGNTPLNFKHIRNRIIQIFKPNSNKPNSNKSNSNKSKDNNNYKYYYPQFEYNN
ncbi:hypothetical protein NEPAR05_2400 [Nematocida parisii]|nr:hypothetical protein NEPAR05_2400 [Nematocida parisii]